MSAHLRANLWLLSLTVLLCSVLYPLVLLGIGQTVFHEKAQGSLIRDAKGNAIGSRLIAQPFTAEEYFQPRPSAASYNAAASGASNWGASNYLLRDRVARQLGPVVKYRSGPKKGQAVGPDIESWFQKDQIDGKPGIVAQWAALHPAVAENCGQIRPGRPILAQTVEVLDLPVKGDQAPLHLQLSIGLINLPVSGKDDKTLDGMIQTGKKGDHQQQDQGYLLLQGHSRSILNSTLAYPRRIQEPGEK